MDYNTLKDIIDALNKELGEEFCRDFAQTRKKILKKGRLGKHTILFKYNKRHSSWAINEGGGTEIQFYISYQDNALSYGLGFNAQHVPFANEKKPSDYIRPYANAFVSLWDEGDDVITALKKVGADIQIDDLRNVKDNTHTFFGFKSIKDPIDENVIREISSLIRDMKPLYFKVLSMGTTNASQINAHPYIALLKNNFNLILSGAPGTGKTRLAREIAASLIQVEEKDLNGNSQFEFVQFHPSYDYTDFVEGLRPKDNGSGNIGFERQDGIFKAFCLEAALAEIEDKDKDKKRIFVFVIDEINRGEISKIFGELFFSIDHGYRGKEKGLVKTQYQNLIDNDYNLSENTYPFKKGFYVPKNVYVIGTMNDIDRSVESMDFAFRRRFAFKEILAEETQEVILTTLDPDLKKTAINKMNALNNAIYRKNTPKSEKNNILEGFSAAYHIGASYFLGIEKYKNDQNKWDELWDFHIKGVLFEYLRGIPDAFVLLDKLEKIYKEAN